MTKSVFSEKVELGNTGLFVSPVGIGALPMGPNQTDLSPKEGGSVIAYAYENGINFIDTAECYKTYSHVKSGLDEIRLNHPDFKRSDIVISSKSLTKDYDEMVKAIDEALTALDTEYIDIFFLHELRSGQFKERAGAWEALTQAKEAGKVKAIGVSTHHADVALEMASIPECDVVFSIINYKGLGIRTSMTEFEINSLDEREKMTLLLRHGSLDKPGTKEEMLDAIKKLNENGKGYFAMKVFGGGNLTSSYQEALDFVTSYMGENNPLISSFMVGFKSKSEIDDIVNYFSGDMPKGYNPDCSKKTVIVNKGDCEGCGTCIKACASNAISFDRDGQAYIEPSKCLTCGYCSPVCPVRAIIMY